jgi:hypothetical protein
MRRVQAMRMRELHNGQFRWELRAADGRQLDKGPTWNSRQKAELDPWQKTGS